MTWPTKETNTKTNTLTQTKTFREHPHRAILKTWPFSTESNCDNWAPYIMTIILTWQLRVTMDNIHNSCIVSIAIAVSNSQAVFFPCWQYIHVFVCVKPWVLKYVLNLYLFAKFQQKGETRDGRGSFPKWAWGGSLDEASLKNIIFKRFGNYI